MIDRQTLKNLSLTGQALLDIETDIVEQLVAIIHEADINECSSQLMMSVKLDETLHLYRESRPNPPITEISYQQRTKVFDVKIDREVISLTVEDLKQLDSMSAA